MGGHSDGPTKGLFSDVCPLGGGLETKEGDVFPGSSTFDCSKVSSAVRTFCVAEDICCRKSSTSCCSSAFL